MKELQTIYDEKHIRNIEDIAEKYGKLMDWFQSEYPEGTIRLEVNSDQRDSTLNYTLTVMSGKESTPNNRLLRKNTITIDRKKFEDQSWMDSFKNSIVPLYKSQITRAFNYHFNQEKEKSAAR